MEHRQLRDLGVEVDDIGHSAFRFPLGLAVSSRVVNIALDILAGKRRQAEMRVALGMAAVPCALWNDGDHSGAERKRLGRSVVADDFQGRRPVEDVNQLITGEMAFPMVGPGGLERQKQPVAIGSQSRDASLCLFPCRAWGSSKHCQRRKFLEALHYFAVHNITWRALPAEFGAWNSVWKRFWRLSQRGVFEAMLAILAGMSGTAHLVQMVDSTIVRAHVSAAGAKGGRTGRRSADRAAGFPAKST